MQEGIEKCQELMAVSTVRRHVDGKALNKHAAYEMVLRKAGHGYLGSNAAAHMLSGHDAEGQLSDKSGNTIRQLTHLAAAAKRVKSRAFFQLLTDEMEESCAQDVEGPSDIHEHAAAPLTSGGSSAAVADAEAPLDSGHGPSDTPAALVAAPQPPAPGDSAHGHDESAALPASLPLPPEPSVASADSLADLFAATPPATPEAHPDSPPTAEEPATALKKSAVRWVHSGCFQGDATTKEVLDQKLYVSKYGHAGMRLSDASLLKDTPEGEAHLDDLEPLVRSQHVLCDVLCVEHGTGAECYHIIDQALRSTGRAGLDRWGSPLGCQALLSYKIHICV